MVPAVSAPAKPYLGRTGMSLAAAVLSVVAGAAFLAAVVLPVNQLTQPGGSIVVTPTDVDEDRRLDVPGLPDGVGVTDDSPDALLTAFDLPAGLRALTELPASLSLLAVGVGCFLLAQVIGTVRAGRPFERQNPRRLAGLAAAVLLGGLVAPLSEGVVSTVVLEYLGLAGPGSPVALFDVTIPLTPVGIALVLLAAAEAFRRGGALEAEVEGMV
jgi:hypothetical protein